MDINIHHVESFELERLYSHSENKVENGILTCGGKKRPFYAVASLRIKTSDGGMYEIHLFSAHCPTAEEAKEKVRIKSPDTDLFKDLARFVNEVRFNENAFVNPEDERRFSELLKLVVDMGVYE